jgi:uncharacterized protein DUF4058
MPSPFPGMDPYLEERNIWPDVHHRLITAIGDELVPQVAPDYFVAVEQRTYVMAVDRQELIARPDAAIIVAPTEARGRTALATAVPTTVQTVLLPQFEEIREGYLEIRDTRTHEVVTAIELLSPTNKMPGEGRDKYEAKRRHVLQTLTNLVEIDFLRGWAPMEMEPDPRNDYRIVVAPGWGRPMARLHAVSVRQPLPDVLVPLREGEAEAVLPLGKLLAEVYDRARYDLRLDYRVPPEPELSPEDATWADELLRAGGLRTQ